MVRRTLGIVFCAGLLMVAAGARAGVCNLRIVTDASPDYHDMPGLVHSVTSQWPTPAEKCWAMYYWNHIARRQTSPMVLHGMALTDPIRQFNDYGYTMCSTISGINCGIWQGMGLKSRYWDISNHTVAEVFYDGRWHMYDNSMSAIYTLCDGKTIAGVEDIGKAGACEASGGRSEPGHIARYHCLSATSPRGFLTGADTIRSLDEEYRCFNPNGLKYRSYFYDWDLGHRYILNLRPGETYTRHYRSLGPTPEFYVPNGGKDPERPNPRYRIRGNGVWDNVPSLTPDGFAEAAYASSNVRAMAEGGIVPTNAGAAGEAVFRVESANVTTAQKITAEVYRRTGDDDARLLVSTSNGLHWQEVWKAAGTGVERAEINLNGPVNGAYEILVKVRLLGRHAAADAQLKSIRIATTTQLNSKTQPRINLGANIVALDTGEAEESIVFWPDLQNGQYKMLVVDERNIASAKQHPGYMGTIHPAVARQDSYIVYRIDAPRDLTRLTIGGRFYNRAPGSRIEIRYSLDAGATWTTAWTLTDTQQPWDVIHYQTIAVPAGHRSALVKYVMNTTEASTSGCSIYALRIEAGLRPVNPSSSPLAVTFRWKEVQKDRSLVERSHTQIVDRLPFRYPINVGGEDHPVMEALSVGLQASAGAIAPGYSDGKDAGGRKHIGRWVEYGRNVAVGKSYSCSVRSGNNWGAGDPTGNKLTDGIVGPPCAGGTSYQSGLIWQGNVNPVITLDLGESMSCASFGMNVHGYPGWDALKGEVKDDVDVLVSDDGKDYRPVGKLEMNLWWKDLPVNHMWPDDEAITGHTFRCVPPEAVKARFVRYQVRSTRFFCATEVEVLDAIRTRPFDLKIALPASRP